MKRQVSPALNLSLGFTSDNGGMTKAAVHALSSLHEPLRMAVVWGCALALMLAGSLPV